MGSAVHAGEFRCLEGAKDPAPYRPGNVVRWCEIWKDGRLLYHGSVWRWYRSGQMAGKEFYVYGNAEGEWPSWYENGKPSSLGVFKNGNKTGHWKYWDEEGRLTTEVTYTAAGNLWMEYYPNGKKKAAGKSVKSGKIGIWTYWDSNGKEKARCDFGDGQFMLSSKACELIASELEPKGFSRPISVAATQDRFAAIRISSQAYQFAIPSGWVADTEAGREEDAPLVFYPKGNSWRDSGPNIYIRVLYKEGATFDDIVKNETEGFEESVAEYTETTTTRGLVPNGKQVLSKSINYKPLIHTDSPFSIISDKIIHESISYLDASDQVVLMVVLTCHSESQLKKAEPALVSLVTTFGAQSDVEKSL